MSLCSPSVLFDFLLTFLRVFTARKRSLRRLCFYRCLSVHTGGGRAWFYLGGMHGFIRGGMCGFIWGMCVVLFGGHAWFYLGGMRGFIRGGVCGFIRGEHAWFYSGVCVVLFGGHAWFYSGGMRGFIWGVCMVLLGGHAWFYSGGHAWFFLGGVHGFFSFFGYNEIRSMSGRYASYWNAFLSRSIFLLFFLGGGVGEASNISRFSVSILVLVASLKALVAVHVLLSRLKHFSFPDVKLQLP